MNRKLCKKKILILLICVFVLKAVNLYAHGSQVHGDVLTTKAIGFLEKKDTSKIYWEIWREPKNGGYFDQIYNGSIREDGIHLSFSEGGLIPILPTNWTKHFYYPLNPPSFRPCATETWFTF